MASATLPKGALWMQNVDYPASWDRTLIDALYAAEGVIDGFAVTPDSGLTINISAGRAIVQGDEVANQGKYLIDSDAVVQLTVASVGSDRTEYVYLAINDTAVAGGRSGNNITIETSETPPADTTLVIATLTLTAGTSTITAGMITDDRVYADVVAPASIATAKLADDAVTTAKIGDDQVTTAKIAGGAVGTTELGSAAVTTAKIGDDQVTQAKIGPGAVDATALGSGAVTTAKIGDDQVTQAKIGPGAVTASEIGSGAVTNAKIGGDAVNGSKIANDSIDSEHYVAGSIDRQHISDDAINSAKIANEQIISALIADDAVIDAKVGAPSTGSLNGNTLRYARLGKLVFVWTSGEANQNGQTLPVGFRPANNVYTVSIYNVGGIPAVNNVLINTSGVIQCPTPESDQFTAVFVTS